MTFAAREGGEAAHAADGARSKVRASPAYRRDEQLDRGVVGALEEHPFCKVNLARHPKFDRALPFALERGGRKHRDAVRLGERPEDARSRGERPRIEPVADTRHLHAQPLLDSRGGRMLHEQPRLHDFSDSQRFAHQIRQRAALAGKLPEERIDERPEYHRCGHREAWKADHRLSRDHGGHRRPPRLHAHAAEQHLSKLLEDLYRMVAPALCRAGADEHKIVFRRALFDIFL